MTKEELDTKGFKVGDEVNFVVGTSLFTGKITKFYKNCFDRVECSVKNHLKAYSHIHLDRLDKVNHKARIINDLINQMIEELQNTKSAIDLDYVITFLQNYKEDK